MPRWRELTGREFRPGSRVSVALRSSIETLQAAPVQGGGNCVVFHRRRHLGAGCDKQWEIAGWYDGPLPCIGQAAVLAALNTAAGNLCKQLCADNCPKECPCTYFPQQRLAKYRCGPKREDGYLLQLTHVWNCRCDEVQG